MTRVEPAFASSEQTVLYQCFTGCIKCSAANFEPAALIIFFEEESCKVSRHSGCWSFMGKAVPATSSSFWSSLSVLYSSSTILWIIILTLKSEILWLSFVWFVMKLWSFQFRIAAPTVFTGTEMFQMFEIMFCSSAFTNSAILWTIALWMFNDSSLSHYFFQT